jgi:hypothetical protein
MKERSGPLILTKIKETNLEPLHTSGTVSRVARNELASDAIE